MKSVSPLRLVALLLTCCTAANAQKFAPPAKAQADSGVCVGFPRLKTEGSRAALKMGQQITVPILNSRPNATALVYLDFDGETVTDPGWDNGNTIVAPAYDLSSNEITTIFNRVKEDWWPFALNITTDVAKYNAAKPGKRMRCIITPNDAAAPGAGGVAYVGSFANAGKSGLTTNVPCWVFNPGIVGIAEAVSHEVGHTMGLSHDGRDIPGVGHEEYFQGFGALTDPTSWCPIMGASYYVNVSQWSKGEYENASNKEDDISIIAGSANGFGFAADDAGDTLATSVPLTITGASTIDQVGLINNENDLDLYSFTTKGGDLDVVASGAIPCPNLDITLELLDSSGQILASDSPTANLSAEIKKTGLAASKYYVRISASGDRDPFKDGYSKYGSIGAYHLTGTVPVSNVNPSATIDDVTVTEGNTGTTNAVFTVTLSSSPSQPVSINFTTSGGTATSGVDFAATSGTLIIRPGSNSGTISVPVNGDTVREGDETFTLNLTNPVNATLADNQGVCTILDDDVPQISVDDIQVQEGNSGVTNAKFTVSLSTASPVSVTAKYVTKDGTATSGIDFTPVSGTITFQPNQTTAKVVVPIIGDTLDEADEVFTLELSQVTNASLSKGSGICTILDDDVSPSLSVDDTSVKEGDKETSFAVFTVHLSSPSGRPVTFTAQTGQSPNSPATPNVDFIPLPAQTVTIPAGKTSVTVSVSVIGDIVREADEHFRLLLTDPVGATLTDGLGVCTILDDDAIPKVSVSDTSVTEGNSGTVKAKFLLTLSSPTFEDVNVTCTTVDGTAKAGQDYVAKTTVITIPAGITSMPVGVQVLGDTLDEDNEKFSLVLSNPAAASIDRGTGYCTIVDDDPKPIATVQPSSMYEGDSGTADLKFKVQLSAVSGRDVIIQYHTVNLSATGGEDFQDTTGELTIKAGQSGGSILIPVYGDTKVEDNEEFYLVLDGAQGANLNGFFVLGTIIDDDRKATLSISDAVITEGNVGTRIMNFVVTLSQPLQRDVSFVVQTGKSTNDPATADVDFVSFARTVYIPAGQTSKTISVSIYGDEIHEADEHFRLLLSNAVNATIADNIGVGTILDDDAPPSLRIRSTTVVEGNSGTTNATLTVSLSQISGQDVSFTYVTGNGSATAGQDYVATTATATIPAGQASVDIKIPIIGDTLDEDDEYFGVGLRNPANATIDQNFAYALCTIYDDDPLPSLSIANVSDKEGDQFSHAFNFVITLSAPSGRTVTVVATTGPANKFPATEGVDYQALEPTTVTFNPGETSKFVSVMVNGDTKVEEDERFQVLLSNNVNANLANSVAVGTIIDDDGVPSAKEF